MRKHRGIKFVTTERRRIYLLSERNCDTTEFFTKKLLDIELKKTQLYMNKPVYLGLSVKELSKILMHEFWHHYVKPKYGEKAKLCDMDTHSFLVHVKTNDPYKDIAEDVATRLDSLNYE